MVERSELSNNLCMMIRKYGESFSLGYLITHYTYWRWPSRTWEKFKGGMWIIMQATVSLLIFIVTNKVLTYFNNCEPDCRSKWNRNGLKFWALGWLICSRGERVSWRLLWSKVWHKVHSVTFYQNLLWCCWLWYTPCLSTEQEVVLSRTML